MPARLDRRTWLKLAGLTPLAWAQVACGATAAPAPVAPPWAPRRFRRVNVAPARVIRTVVGLRPFRPSGFVVRGERMDGKAVIHDYGHGGGGVTLSWGTADLAVGEALETGERSAAVIGCGAVGLATARLLQRHGWYVTIYARDLPPNTTSNVAGASWAPTTVADSGRITGAFGRQFDEASRRAHRHFQTLVGPYYGIRWIEYYFPSDEPFAPSGYLERLPELFPDLEELGPGEHPFPTRNALRYTSMLIEPSIYLEAMLREFRIAGGRVVVRELHEPSEIVALPEPVIMNCTGLGARDLFGDEELTPVKGQLTVVLPQPDVEYVTVMDGLYMMPRSDGIILGGTFQRGVWTLEPDPVEADRIMRGHVEFFGAMTEG